MLKSFLAPRWQHPDAQVRRTAVDGLSPREDAAALAQVAREDEVPGIRRLALRHTLDLALLEERAASDPDAEAREQATRRYRMLLAGLVDAGPPLDERMALAARSDDTTLIEYLARESADEALRVHALARVQRETVLRDVALGDPTPELRLEALARIEDEAVLARIYEQSRKNDKRVSHAARERLEALRDARERPQKVADESARICEALETLACDGHWERDAPSLHELEQRWEALDAAHRDAFATRYAAARQGCEDALNAHRARAEDARARAQALVAQLAELSAGPEAGSRETVNGWVAACEKALGQVPVSLEASATLPSADAHALEDELRGAESAVREAMARARRRRELERLLGKHQRLAQRRGIVAESEVKALGRALDELPDAPVPGAELEALARRVQRAHEKLRARLREQADWKRDTLASLTERLDTLAVAVKEGRAKQAIADHDPLAADLDALLAAGTSADRLTGERRRLSKLTREVDVMRAWERYGARAAHERLCEEMEALAGSEQPPPDIARQVREARAAWKELSHSAENAAGQALWRRFDAAATAAYEPCKAWFAERASARKTNVERRRALLDELATFLAATSGGPDTDWKAAVRFRRELLARWHDAQPVERGPGKALAATLDARLAELDALLGRERERSARQREQLIAEAEGLAKSDDKKAAAEACKRLQRQWQVTVPGGRRRENELWRRFRAACDSVFSDRAQVFEAERENAKAGLAERKALCERVEALADGAAGDIDAAERELHRAQGEWSRSAAPPGREAQALEKRFAVAVRRFAAHRADLEARGRREAMALMREKAALCHAAESAGGDGAPGAEAIAELEQRWSALGMLPEDDETVLARRFRDAIGRAAGDAAPDGGALAENLAARESICLRLEILAGVDSPPEHAAARMALQVERLSSALSERARGAAESPETLLRAWCRAGPAPRAAAAGLEARFEHAWSALERAH